MLIKTWNKNEVIGTFDDLNTSYQRIIENCKQKLDASLPCSSHVNYCCKCDSLCSSGCVTNNHCIECLSNIFRDDSHRLRNYECQPITYTYMLRYLNRYTSEIYTIISKPDNLINSVQGNNVISIGCGPATELIGLKRALTEKNVSTTYYGFDKNAIWSNVQNIVKNELSSQHLKINFNQSESIEQLLPQTNLLILHYLLSHIHKHTETEDKNQNVISFLNEFIYQKIKLMPVNSYIIINDVNSNNMGRDALQKWVKELPQQTFKKLYGSFEYVKQDKNGKNYSVNFDTHLNPETICEKSLIFSDNTDISLYNEGVSECNSAFVILQKTGVL